jgi:hypothetical protein
MDHHQLRVEHLHAIGIADHATLTRLLLRDVLDPADVVLELLTAGCVDAVEALLGKPITRGPGPDFSRRYISQCQPRPPEPRIRHIHPDPRYICRNRGGRLYARPLQDTMLDRYNILRLGMPVSSALQRGVQRRDFRLWTGHGWVEVR